MRRGRSRRIREHARCAARPGRAFLYVQAQSRHPKPGGSECPAWNPWNRCWPRMADGSWSRRLGQAARAVQMTFSTGETNDLPRRPRLAGRERQDTLLANAGAARTARQARLHRRQAAAPAAFGSPGRRASMSAGMCSAVSWLSFGRIIDIPFEISVAALESWQRTGQDGELRIGQSLLRWPIEYDRDCCTCRIEVGLARGPRRPPRRMRLEINCWSPSCSRTALELIPCQRVRPTEAYFRSGHLLLDSLTHSLLQHMPAQHLDRVPAAPSTRQLPAGIRRRGRCAAGSGGRRSRDAEGR